jgi:hypothetical protein
MKAIVTRTSADPRSSPTQHTPGRAPHKGHGHRHTNGHEHDFEPVRGLPEDLPAGEQIVWQGSPSMPELAVQAFHLRKLAIYFGVLLAYQAAWVLASGGGFGAVIRSLAWPTGLALLGLGTVALLAYMCARTTVYTVTNRRVVMRVGIVLTLAFNLPYSRIAAAAVKVGRRDTGDISLSLDSGNRIAWLTLWPHARPWHVARPQPTFRSVANVAAVGQLLAEQWALATNRKLAGATGEETAAGVTTTDPHQPPATAISALTAATPPATATAVHTDSAPGQPLPVPLMGQAVLAAR